MSGHVSACPNRQTGRITPLEFRAHVAMMCGSFGLELDPPGFTPAERETIPALIKLSESIAPFIVM
jgi:alpha-galactosidase